MWPGRFETKARDFCLQGVLLEKEAVKVVVVLHVEDQTLWFCTHAVSFVASRLYVALYVGQASEGHSYVYDLHTGRTAVTAFHHRHCGVENVGGFADQWRPATTGRRPGSLQCRVLRLRSHHEFARLWFFLAVSKSSTSFYSNGSNSPQYLSMTPLLVSTETGHDHYSSMCVP